MENDNLAKLYDSYYFAHDCGLPYEHNEHWVNFFGGIADQIIRQINPKTVLDAGCAMGFLVEALRKRGVEAWGIDISEYAISRVDESVKPYCKVASISQPFERHYDLIVNIEVLEHMRTVEAGKAVENMCAHTDNVLFSSTPFDYKEATHINVHPPEYWVQLFAQYDFYRNIDFDGSFITVWAVFFEKKKLNLLQMIRNYERRFFALWKENNDIRRLVTEQLTQLSRYETATSNIQPLQEKLTSHAFSIAKLQETIAERDKSLAILSAQNLAQNNEAANLTAQLMAIQASRAWRLVYGLQNLRLKLVPHGSKRERLYYWFFETLIVAVKRQLVNPAPATTQSIPKVVSVQSLTKAIPEDVAPIQPKDEVISEETTPAQPEDEVIPQEAMPAQLQTEVISEEVALAQPAPQAAHTPLEPKSTSDQRLENPTTPERLLSEHFKSLRPLLGFQVSQEKLRLNLITDSINADNLFSKVNTAIILSALLARRWNCDLRIITRTESAVKNNYNHVLGMNGIIFEKNIEFVLGDIDNPNAIVPIGDGDVFLTTSWWTTWAVREIFGEKKIIYLLQEDERTFYPFGDQYLRCVELLKSPNIQFLINSKLLYDHFCKDKFKTIMKNGIWFEPAFSRNIFFDEAQPHQQKKSFFFYACPNNVHNLFYRGLEVLDSAINRGILNLAEWDIYFAGKDLPRIQLNGGYSPQFVQNLNWMDYAAVVRKIDLGLSLMYGPHPSYPVLGLAASGAVVVTNRFGDKKDLSFYSHNILCRDIDQASLLDGIVEGIKLSSNSQTRNYNYENSATLRDWQISFSDVLVKLDMWQQKCS